MNPAKLRRSRDVSEIQRSKIEKGFRISDLALLNMAFCFGSYRQESARQTSDVIAQIADFQSTAYFKTIPHI
jgi:hypothetical protein